MSAFPVTRHGPGPRWDPTRPLKARSDRIAPARHGGYPVAREATVLAGPVRVGERVVQAREALSGEALAETLAADPWIRNHRVDGLEPPSARLDAPCPRDPREAGVSIVSALAGVVIVLVLGSLVLSQAMGGGPTAPTRATARTPGSTVTTAAPTLANVPPAAARAACLADVATIESAAGAYESLHGAPPPSGTAWATEPGGPLAGQRWPAGDGSFSLVWTGRSVGVRATRGPRAHETIDGVAGCAGL
ncbi:MAG: hypothetical protein ACYCRG_08945 [Acidimicrobiales bacterium]